ncbi:unnamed protein product, partial [Rotaria magnacalcarata]
MRHITKEYRVQEMSLYVQSTNRECEILTDEIKHIIEGFPRNTEENDEQVDAESGYIEFKHYNELREKRLNLEAEQSIYFLEAQRVEGEIKEQEEEIIATTFTRSNGKKKNYRRLVKRLKHKIRSASVALQKTDKSKVFHLGTRQHYQKKSNEYMEKTEAYQCLSVNDPLPNLIERTNKYLLDLRLAHWITQKQYELLCVKPSEA